MTAITLRTVMLKPRPHTVLLVVMVSGLETRPRFA
jgi:hypothetical protein